ncbi:MAG: RNA methyltransferase [Bacteroidales bacterium]|jgi:tRNA G18 (ribose-2'-O)-methylase SpoU
MRKLKLSELNRITVEEFKRSPKTPIIIVLDNVRSLYNIGSIFRTADAFRLESIYLCGITGTPPNKEIHKSALGATESVDWKYFENTLDAINILKENNYNIIVVEQVEGSSGLEELSFSPSEKIALIFGNEINGVDEKIICHANKCIEIPQFGTKHSLNISVSVGIVVWELFRKMHL